MSEFGWFGMSEVKMVEEEKQNLSVTGWARYRNQTTGRVVTTKKYYQYINHEERHRKEDTDDVTKYIGMKSALPCAY